MNFEVKDSKIIFSGKVFDVQVDNIKYNSGNTAPREVVIHKGGAVVVAVKESGKIILVRQYRYPFHKWLLELPAGKLERGEDPMVCAGRELTEETGFSAGKITPLGSIYTSPGFSSEELFIFLATNLTAGESNREEGEDGMEIFELEAAEIINKIETGEIKDSKTIAGIFYYQNMISK